MVVTIYFVCGGLMRNLEFLRSPSKNSMSQLGHKEKLEPGNQVDEISPSKNSMPQQGHKEKWDQADEIMFFCYLPIIMRARIILQQ